MLRESSHYERREGDLVRTWYVGEQLDLIIWRSDRGELRCFQLTYRRAGGERLVAWNTTDGFAHDRVDEGETSPAKHKMAPILTAERSFDPTYVSSLLASEGQGLEPELLAIISRTLSEYPVTVAEYIQARWDGSIEDPLWLGWAPPFRMDSGPAITRYVGENRALPSQVLELLGAWAVLLCLRQTRWAPAGSVIDSTSRLLQDLTLPVSEDRQRAFLDGIEKVCEQIRRAEHDGIPVVSLATESFIKMLNAPFRS